MALIIKSPQLFSVADVMAQGNHQMVARARMKLAKSPDFRPWEIVMQEVMQEHAEANGIIAVKVGKNHLHTHQWLHERNFKDYAIRAPFLYLRDPNLAFEIKLLFG